MRTLTKGYCILILLALTQTQGAPLLKVIEDSLNQNLTLKQDHAALQERSFQYKEAKSFWFPSLSGDTSWQHVQNKNHYQHFIWSLTAQQTLFKRSDWVQLQTAALEKKHALLQTKITRNQIIETTIETYLNIAEIEQKIAIENATITLFKQQLRINQIKLKNGLSQHTDSLILQANIAQATQALFQMKQAHLAFMKQLDLLTQHHYDNIWHLKHTPVLNTPSATDLEAFMARNLTIQLADNQLKLSDASLQLASSDHWPDLSLSAQYQEDHFNGTNAALANKIPGNTLSIGISIHWPLFSGGKVTYATRAASAHYLKTMTEDQWTTQNMLNQVQIKLAALHTNWMTIQSNQKWWAASKAALNNNKLRYKEGLINIYDLRESILNANQAKQNLISSQYQRLILLTQLHSLNNQLTDPWLAWLSQQFQSDQSLPQKQLDKRHIN